MSELRIRFIENKWDKHVKRKKFRQTHGDLALGKYFKDFLSKLSIHGFNHLTEKGRPFIEYFMWCCVVMAAIYNALSLSLSTWTRYMQNPTVISVEKDNLFWNNTFPAATICPTTKVDMARVEQFVDASKVANKTLLREFVLALTNLTNRNFDELPDNAYIKPEEYMDVILAVQFQFRAKISLVGMEQRVIKLERVVTEMGICYTFNSVIAVYNSPSYWQNGKWDLVPENDIVTIHALDGEVVANIVNISSGFELYIHGPYEVADVASKSVVSPNGYFLQVYLDGLTLFSSDRIRDLKINQRKCRFYDESDLRHSPAYSYVLCRMECRAALANRLCGCIPHFYRKLARDKTCDVKGLHCLAKHKERLIVLKGECKCLANCDEVNYLVEDMDTREWFLGSNLQWGLKEYPKMRLRRDVIFGFSDLLVYIGGMAGLFLGCSVLSFIEIIYFFTLRLYWYVIKYRNDTKKMLRHNRVHKLPIS